MKTLVKILFMLVLASVFTGKAYAQQTAKQIEEANKAAAIQKSVETKHYTFVAQYALPRGGGQKYLTGDYDLYVSKDSVIAYLPYFGRVYMDPPMDPNDAGIKFTATKFDYKKEDKKKGGWNITITPKNVKYTTKLDLDIYANGTAYLLVTSYNRDQISFNGYIKVDQPK